MLWTFSPLLWLLTVLLKYALLWVCGFILLGVCLAFWIYRFMYFANFWKFSVILISNSYSFPISLLGLYKVDVSTIDWVPWVPYDLFIFLYSFFFLIITLQIFILSSGMLFLSWVFHCLLFKLSGKFKIFQVLHFFSSKILFGLFL